MNYTTKTLAAIALASATVLAHSTVLTFDNLAVGTTLSNQYAGVVFSPNALTGAGFATNSDMTIVSSTGNDVGFGGLGSQGLVAGNVLRSFAAWLNETGDPSFRVTFASAVTSFSADFAGVNDAANVRLFAYDGSTLLGSVTGTSLNSQFELSFAGSHITSVVVAPGTLDDYVAVDNIQYVSAVPEPSTWAMAGLGMAMLGWLARARRRNV